MKTLLIAILCCLPIAAWAQSDSDPGREFDATNLPVQEYDTNAQTLFQPLLTQFTQSSSAIAEHITPDIQALAENLGNDPTRIFNYVHDQIRYIHYFGSLKGAELTLLERSGNDFDQCALLSALLQAAGYTNAPGSNGGIGYQFGLVNVPYDATNGTDNDLHHWLGLSLQNTNWTNTLNYFNYLSGVRGYSVAFILPNDTNDFIFQHVWLTLTMGGTNYYLDPSFKVSQPITNGINLASAMGLSLSTLTNASGGTDNGYSVSGLTEASLRGALQNCNSNLLTYLSNNIPNATMAQVVGGEQIVPASGSPFRTALIFPAVPNGTYPLLNWTNIPTTFMSTFTIEFGGQIMVWQTPQLEGQRVSLTFSNGLAQLWLEDSPIEQTSNTGSSNSTPVILMIQHPGAWVTGANQPNTSSIFDRSSTNLYQTTASSYAIMYGFDSSPQWLQERQQKLAAYQAQGYTNTSRQVVTETLNVMGLTWMMQTESSLELTAQEWGQLPHDQHRFGRMGQEAGRGYYVDVYMQLDSTVPNTGANPSDLAAENQVFDVTSYIWSAMEHGMIEQLQDSNLVAASTVKMIQIANTNSQTVYLITNSSVWTSISNNVINYGSTFATLNSLANAGFDLLVPANGSNHVASTGSWAGNGYVELGTVAGLRTMGMLINSEYNGGFVDDQNATVNTPFVLLSAGAQSTYNFPQSPTLQLAAQIGADPVNLVDGSFQVSSSDLALGQTEPRGLNLTRFYASTRRGSNPGSMAPGWVHNYCCTATPISDPQNGLGGATVEAMSPMVVATYAALNWYNNINPDAKNWAVTALIAKWGIDQLENNAVSVNLGKDTLEFVRQPDGTYLPPGNCTMSLLQTNGAFWMQERNGRTFKFAGSGVLTNIIDQYGRPMTLQYNSSIQLTNVTDWTNRSLTFNYTNGVLASVADSTGRSVHYGYAGGELTSFMDAEGKTNGYTYDTNDEIVATYDALGRLVVSNNYDGFGHITTQLTEGDPNKTWQVFASGYQTVEIDPGGDEQVYTYDSKSRLIAQQDGLGNVTQMAYDGQDHVIQTVSPMNETSQFVYDGNNNLIESIDPLGHSNVFFFDSQNRLTKSLDGLGNPTTYAYNAQSSLIGQTNSAGDYVNYAYNNDGTLYSRTDSGGTTTYGYDGHGDLSSITYPGSLGSEGFLNNAYGDVLTHTNGNRFLTSFQYNNRRQLTNTIVPTNLTVSVILDAVGNVIKTTDARMNSMSNTWSITRKLTSTTLPTTPPGVVTNIYDNRDWLMETKDPLTLPTSSTNNAAGWLIGVTDPLSRTTQFGYDDDGRKTSAENAALETTAQLWNAGGELTKVTDNASHTALRVYDAAGNQITLTNRNTNAWHFYYDAANRLTNTVSPMGASTRSTFNHQGLVSSIIDPSGTPHTFFYDPKGRMTNRTDSIGSTFYGYDNNDNRTIVSENGQTLSWTYDAYNHVASFTNAAGDSIQYNYDNNGNLTNLIYPGGKNVAYVYDSLNRMTSVTDWEGRQTTIAYDLDSRITSITRPNGTSRTINYDNDGEVTNIVEQAATKAPIAFYTMNWNNNGTVGWEFGAPLPHTNAPPNRMMTYLPDNTIFVLNGEGLLYDTNGNMTFGPLLNDNLTNYTYDVRNRLLNAGSSSYGYDPSGNRNWVTNGATVTQYVVNPNAALPQTLMRIQNGVTNYYVYGVGLLYQVTETPSGETTLTYHYDSRGSTVALTDGNGNVTDRVEYSAYGMTTLRGGTNDTPFLYNGRYGVMTDANGLLYMRARYYNPYICRFVNPDPSGFGGGLNWYAYANGDPVSLLDPFGLSVVGENAPDTWNLGGQNLVSNASMSPPAWTFSLNFDVSTYLQPPSANTISLDLSSMPATQAGSPGTIGPPADSDPMATMNLTIGAQGFSGTQFGQQFAQGNAANILTAPASGMLGNFIGNALAANTGTQALEPMANAAINTGTIRTVAGYEVAGNAGLVGQTYNMNIWGLYATENSQGLFSLANSLKAEASAAGASQISITGNAVINQGLLNMSPGLAGRFGFQVNQVNSATILLQGGVP